ncbi:hypothetical protein ACHAQH_009541 [Verticillium albo-atrum]
MEPVTLSDGVTIPKGSYTMVSLDKMSDETVFDEPDRFKPVRFLEMRKQPGHENRWHFVTTSPEHLVFGHGKHSCPGRFFAANEAKVILTYLLMRFDWMVGEQGLKEEVYNGTDMSADPDAKVLIKVRDQDVLL